MNTPVARPKGPGFSCGPAQKIPGWTPELLNKALVSRSHRAAPCRARIRQVGEEIKALLELPSDYLVATMAGSDTGAVEAALWSLLGPRPVDVFGWEAFGCDWVTDIMDQLKPLEARSFVAPYGHLPDLSQARPDHDVVFTWNGTAAGVKVPDGAAWIADDRTGLTICDATSAVMGMPIPWRKLDVITFSWQKMFGGEAQHGTLILGPRAVERLNTHTPVWGIPKLFRLTKNGKLHAPIFDDEPINTPSMLCIEDMLVAMQWLRDHGGLAGGIERCHANADVLGDWVARTPWVDFLPPDPAVRSHTAVCLKIVDPEYLRLSDAEQRAFCQRLVRMVEDAGAAYDFNAYKDAPPGLRVMCGSTIMPEDVAILTHWIDWAFAACHAEMKVLA